MPSVHRVVPYAFAVAAGFFTLSCAALLDAKVTPDGTSTAATTTPTATDANTQASDSNAAASTDSNTTTATNSNTASNANTAGNSNTASNTNATSNANATGTSSSGCATATVGYTGAVATVITNKCQACHSSQSPSMGTYAAAKAGFGAGGGKAAVDAGAMPIGGSTFVLTTAEKCLLTNWEAGGYTQ